MVWSVRWEDCLGCRVANGSLDRKVPVAAALLISLPLTLPEDRVAVRLGLWNSMWAYLMRQ